jgi:hypothetical protein
VKPIDYAVEWYSVNFEWSETAEMISSRFTQPDNVYSDFEDADIFANQQTELGLAKLVTCLASRSNVTSNKIKLNTKVRAVSIRDTQCWFLACKLQAGCTAATSNPIREWPPP